MNTPQEQDNKKTESFNIKDVKIKREIYEALNMLVGARLIDRNQADQLLLKYQSDLKHKTIEETIIGVNKISKKINEYILANYSKMTIYEIANHLKISIESVGSRANYLGLRKKKYNPLTGRSSHKLKPWTESDDKFLCMNHLDFSIGELSAALGRCESEIHSRIFDLKRMGVIDDSI